MGFLSKQRARLGRPRGDSSQRRRLFLETLEDRRLLAVSFEFNYLGGNSIGFNDPVHGASFRTALESAASRLGGWLLDDATIQMDVGSEAFDGSSVARAASEPPPLAPDGGFFHGVIPGKILGQVDANGAAADGRLDVAFFSASDSLVYVTNPADADESQEIDFQAVMIHELVHALGFTSATNPDGSDDSGNGLTTPGTWSALDRYLSDAAGNRLIGSDFRMDMSATGWPLHSVGGKGPSGGLFFDGPVANQVYGGPVPLYSPAGDASNYLNDQNITVALGASMDPEPFANRTTADSLASVIDAPSADAPEDHTQSTHLWVSNNDLELDFDFGADYVVTKFHFWNYFSESYDVDDVDVRFFDASGALVGQLIDLEPMLGGDGGNPIYAEDFDVSLSGTVRRVNVMLSGSNGQVDFNNIGFSVADGTNANFSVPHLDSEDFAGGNSLFSPATHLMSHTYVGGAVPQELTLLEKAILADIGILLREDVAPTLTVPPSTTIEGNATGGFFGTNQEFADYLSLAQVTDRVDPNPIVTHDRPTFLPLGPNTISFTATDASGNFVSDTSVLTVVDTTAPQWDLPADATVSSNLPTGADLNNQQLIDLISGAATDIVDNSLTITAEPTTFPIGTTPVTFTATDASGNTSSVILSLTVVDTNVIIDWDNPESIVFGTLLDTTQLNATATVAGTEVAGSFDYNPPAGTRLDAGSAQELRVTFTPDDLATYDSAQATVTIDVLKADPVVDWADPDPIVFGTPLGDEQLDATSSVAGIFTYQPAATTILDAGEDQQLSVTFTPVDTDNFNSVSQSVVIDVAPATPVISWSMPEDITFGTPLGSQQLGATSQVAGSFAYSPAAGETLAAGPGQTLQVTFTPDSNNYEPVTASVTIDVLKADPEITWSDPADLYVGTALDDTQLNASSTVDGQFSYAPGSGTVLDLGNQQELTATFTPGDLDNYNVVSATVQINVIDAPDFGDAPDAYPVLFSDDGARHAVSTLTLGSEVDAESNGQPSVGANGDGEDDDGVIPVSDLLGSAGESTTASFEVEVSGAGKLDAWIDFNADGDWDDSGEQVFAGIDVTDGMNVLAFTVPEDAAAGTTAARFRLSSSGGLSPTGSATDGEVEDYLLTIMDGAQSPAVQARSVGPSIGLSAQDGRIVVNSQQLELFRSPMASVGSLEIAGREDDQSVTIDVGGDGVVPAGGLKLTGAGGANVLLVVGDGGAFDLTDPLVHATDFQTLDLSSGDSNVVTLDAQQVAGLSPSSSRLTILAEEGDRIILTDASDWRMSEPRISGGTFLVTAANMAGGDEVIEADIAHPWQNFLRAGDVNNDGNVTSSDALRIINELARRNFSDSETGRLTDPLQLETWPGVYFDQNGDDHASALDALRVINELARLGLEGELPGAEPRVAPPSGTDSETEMSVPHAENVPPTIPSALIVDDSPWHDEAQPVAATPIDSTSLSRETETRAVDELLSDDAFVEQLS